jgi:hypothetical protein
MALRDSSMVAAVITGLVYLLVYLLIVGVLLWLALYIIQTLPLPSPFAQVARVVVTVIGCLILVLMLLNFLGLMPGERAMLR